MVHAIGQGHPGYKTRHPYSWTQKTTCPAQTKKKLKFTTPLTSAELAHELPFSEEGGIEPWDTPKERVDTIKKTLKRGIRKKAAGVAKKKAAGLAKKALEWKTWKTP